MSFVLGAQETLFGGAEVIVPGADLLEKLTTRERLGYGGIELSRASQDLGLPALKEALRRTSVRVSVVGGPRELLLPDPGEREEARSRLKERLAYAAELGASGFVLVPVRGAAKLPDLSPWRSTLEIERDVLVPLFSSAAPSAARRHLPIR